MNERSFALEDFILLKRVCVTMNWLKEHVKARVWNVDMEKCALSTSGGW